MIQRSNTRMNKKFRSTQKLIRDDYATDIHGKLFTANILIILVILSS
jgi:hypothetical protein